MENYPPSCYQSVDTSSQNHVESNASDPNELFGFFSLSKNGHHEDDEVDSFQTVSELMDSTSHKPSTGENKFSNVIAPKNLTTLLQKKLETKNIDEGVIRLLTEEANEFVKRISIEAMNNRDRRANNRERSVAKQDLYLSLASFPEYTSLLERALKKKLLDVELFESCVGKLPETTSEVKHIEEPVLNEVFCESSEEEPQYLNSAFLV